MGAPNGLAMNATCPKVYFSAIRIGALLLIFSI